MAHPDCLAWLGNTATFCHGSQTLCSVIPSFSEELLRTFAVPSPAPDNAQALRLPGWVLEVQTHTNTEEWFGNMDYEGNKRGQYGTCGQEGMRYTWVRWPGTNRS